MEEPTSENPAVAGSEKSRESEFNTEKTLSGATMNTQTNKSPNPKTEVDASNTGQILIIKKSENQSNASGSVPKKDLAEKTIVTSGEVPEAEFVTAVNHCEPETAKSSVEIHPDSDSTSHNDTTAQNVTAIDNNNVSSDVQNNTTQSMTAIDSNNVNSDVQNVTTQSTSQSVTAIDSNNVNSDVHNVTTQSTTQSVTAIDSNNVNSDVHNVTTQSETALNNNNLNSDVHNVTTQNMTSIDSNNVNSDVQNVTTQSTTQSVITIDSNNVNSDVHNVTTQSETAIDSKNVNSDVHNVTTQSDTAIDSNNVNSDVHNVTTQSVTTIDSNNVYSDVHNVTTQSETAIDSKNVNSDVHNVTTQSVTALDSNNLNSDVHDVTTQSVTAIDKNNLNSDVQSTTQSETALDSNNLNSDVHNVITQSVTAIDKNNLNSDVQSTTQSETAIDKNNVNSDVHNVTTQNETAIDNNNAYSDVQNNTTDGQCEPAELVSNDAVNKVTKEMKVQSSHCPLIIPVKRKPLIRKSSGKLTTIVQRLNAQKGDAVAPKCSTLNDSNILIKSSLSEAEASVINQSHSSESSSVSGICAEASVINQSHSSESSSVSGICAEASVINQSHSSESSAVSGVCAEASVINQSHSSESSSVSGICAEASVINQSHSSESSSVSGICAEATNTEQAKNSFKEVSSSTTDNSPLSFIEIKQNLLTKKAKLTFKISPKTASPADNHHEKSAANSSKAQTSKFKHIQPADPIPIKIIKSSESMQSGSQRRSTDPTSLSLQHSKPSQTCLKTGAQVFRVSGTVNEPNKYITPVEATSIASLGQQTLISTDKGNYVLGYVSLKGPLVHTQPLESKGHNPSVGSAFESDPKTPNMQTAISKSKHQFSLLQQISSKQPVSLNTSTCDISKAPVVYSLLANSPSKPSKHSIIQSSGINAPTTTFNLLSPVVMPNKTKPALAQCSAPNRFILTSHNPGQICFQPVPYAAVTSSNSQSLGISNQAISNLATAVMKKSKVQTPIAPNAYLLTTTPPRQPAVIVMPASTAGTTLKTFLTISTTGYSQTGTPAGITTISKISAATTKAKTVKTTIYSTANPEPSPINQQLSDTHQSCSSLITKIVKKSLSHTSENVPAVNVQTNLAHPLGAAVKPQLAPDNSKPSAALPRSCRIIVSKDSSIKVVTNSGSLQAEGSLSTKDAASDSSGFQMYATDALTVSKLLQALNASQTSAAAKTLQTSAAFKTLQTSVGSKTLQTSAATNTSQTSTASKTLQTSAASKALQTSAATNTSQTSVASKTLQTSEISKTAQTYVTIPAIYSNNASTPTPSCPNPVKVTASCPANISNVRLLPQTFKLVLPAKNAVSLLNISSTPTILQHASASVQTSTNVSNATETPQVRKQLKPKPVRSIKKRVLDNNNCKISSTTSSVLNPSLSSMSVETNTRTPRKTRENTTYSATVRTGQGPVSVIVVAPNLEDDSSDTMSDNSISSFRSAVQSQLDNKDARGLGNAEKLSYFRCSEKTWTSNQDVQDVTATNKADNLPYKLSCSETGILDLRCLEELEASNQGAQSRFPGVDDAGSDTMSDTEVSHLRFSNEAETLDHSFQHRSASFDDEEETDSDLDIINTEEQDMSVLRQLLIGTDTAGMYAVTEKQLQEENSLQPSIADDIINRQYQLQLDTAHKTHLTSHLEKSENKLSSKAGSVQQLLLAPFAPNLQSHVTDQAVKQQPEDSDFCGLKIESIFSLSSNAELEEPGFFTDYGTLENNPDLQDDDSLVFNVRDSSDWNNYVNPCFVVLERLPKSDVLAKGSCEIQSKCSEHCRKRTLDYLCNLNLLKCVNHPEVALFLKPKRKIAVKRSRGKFVMHKEARKEMSLRRTIVESSPLYPPLLGDLKQELLQEQDIKPSLDVSLLSPITEDTIQTSVISKTDFYEMGKSLSLEQVGEKVENIMSPGLNFNNSSSDLRKFLKGLKQLKKQVVRKRAKMLKQKLLKQKLTRKTKDGSLVRRKTKLIKSKPHNLLLTKNIQVSTKKIRYTPANRTIAVQKTVIENISSTEHHAYRLPKSSGISHHISPKKKSQPASDLSSFIKKYKIRKRGVFPVTANTTQLPVPANASQLPAPANAAQLPVPANAAQLPERANTAQLPAPKVLIPKLRTGANVVSIQPKLHPLPEEKVKAALHSLNSYLEATGKKPTEGNTQYILLKIDDQHILVKLPFTSASTALVNTVTLSNLKTVPATSSINQALYGGALSAQAHLQMQSESSIAKTIANTEATTVSNINTAPTAVLNSNTATTAQTFENINKSVLKLMKMPYKTASSSIVKTSSNTSSLVSRNTKKAKAAKPNLSIRKITSYVAGPNGLLEKTTTNSAKRIRSITSPHENLYQNVSSVENPAVNVSLNVGHSSHTSGTYSSATSSSGAHKAIISLLRPFVPPESQPSNSARTLVYQRKNVSSTTMPPVPFNVSYSPAPDSSMKAASVPSTVLSNLPPNSSLLPERKGKSAALSEKARENKRRRLEAKYPLPPGIVIKSEPDDLDYELSTNVIATSGASDYGSFHVLNMEHDLDKELPGMYSQDQAWSVSNSIKTVSLLSKTAGQGLLEEQDSIRNVSVMNIPAHSSSGMEQMLPREPSENIEDSSDELDEPPALLDETTADDMEESIETYDIVNTLEDMPPVLQPMFTSSCSSLVEDTDIMKIENTGFTKKKTVNMEDLSPRGTKDSNKAADSTSSTSLYSEGSQDSGIDSNIPSNSSSYTSVRYFSTPATEKPVCKNLKIQHLKELLKKKEMEIENMKKLQTEFPSLDLDHL